MTKRSETLETAVYGLALLLLGVVAFHVLRARRTPVQPPAATANPSRLEDPAAREPYRAVDSLPPLRVKRPPPTRSTRTSPVPPP